MSQEIPVSLLPYRSVRRLCDFCSTLTQRRILNQAMRLRSTEEIFPPPVSVSPITLMFCACDFEQYVDTTSTLLYLLSAAQVCLEGDDDWEDVTLDLRWAMR